jgi:hypothetical protein
MGGKYIVISNVVMPAKAGIQALKGIARFARELKI